MVVIPHQVNWWVVVVVVVVIGGWVVVVVVIVWGCRVDIYDPYHFLDCTLLP